MARKPSKITRYRRPLNINVGMIIFAIIFIYIVFYAYTYSKKGRVQFYEVVDGSIMSSREHRGLILRQEETNYADRSGYISYYLREGKRASVGTRIYSIDETGRLASYLQENQIAGVNLTNENLADIKKQLSSFSMGFQNWNFGASYDFQYSLEAMIMEYVSFNALDNLDMIQEESGISFQQVRSGKAGVISYGIDGYETLEPADVEASLYDRTNYAKATPKTGPLIASGAPVYKIITDNNWSVIFELTDDEVAEYSGSQKLTAKFSGESLAAKGDFSIMKGKDGKQYGKLDFSHYMVHFVSDRFVNFEIASEQPGGLKIPVSAVTTKNFFLVPAEYLTQGGNTFNSGFNREVYADTGNSVEFVAAELYNSNDDYYYIDAGETGPLKAGDYIVKPNSTSRYQIGQTASLQGVYNINKGYAAFKQIEILNSNNEYYTIKKGTKYGLTIYDHIVLNADSVHEGALIYK